tara:strand:+ start:3385 stop:3624 length:240 start_codon:yes stop_codon:yes gene_type:complete
MTTKQEQTKSALVELNNAKQTLAGEIQREVAGLCSSFAEQYGISIASIDIGFIEVATISDAFYRTEVGRVGVRLCLPSL